MLGFLLAATFTFMSDRAQFWDPDDVSNETEEIVNGPEFPANFSSFQNQKVLLLVHGFNTSGEDVKATYQTIVKHIDPFGLYDAVIGYVWPGYDEALDYFEAEENANGLAERMQGHLRELCKVARSVDILAHSMGNRLLFKALDCTLTDKPLIRNFYSVAPAVNANSIEVANIFYRSAQQCQELCVFHSNHDEVLKWAYILAELSEALGYEGDADPDKEAPNVQFIDCTPFVNGHSAYFQAIPFYLYIQLQNLQRIPSPKTAQNVILQQNGTVLSLAAKQLD